MQFEGDGLAAADAQNDPLKYRKYALPEEPADNTEPHRRLMPDLSMSVPPEGQTPLGGPGSSAPQGLSSTMVHPAGFASVPPAAPSLRPSNRPPSARPGAPGASGAPGAFQGQGQNEEERIEIPGTHVPAWVVVALVVGVVAILTGTAILLLR